MPRSFLCNIVIGAHEIYTMTTAAQSPNPEPVIEFRDVGYESSGREILASLNLAIHRGEILVLLGRSGSGKTTALKLVNRRPIVRVHNLGPWLVRDLPPIEEHVPRPLNVLGDRSLSEAMGVPR